jgi:hypothetical protein
MHLGCNSVLVSFQLMLKTKVQVTVNNQVEIPPGTNERVRSDFYCFTRRFARLFLAAGVAFRISNVYKLQFSYTNRHGNRGFLQV